MVRTLSLSPVLTACGVFVALGVVALSPAKATAQCGNYVRILNGANPEPMEDHSPKAPCNGPGCSQLPSIPFTPLPAPIVTNVDSKACVDHLRQSPPSAGERAIPDAADTRPVRVPSSIFHPPRVG
jgi:hypothetical protein